VFGLPTKYWASHARAVAAGLRRRYSRAHDLAPVFQRYSIQQHAHVVGFGAPMGEGAFDVTLFLTRHALSATDSVLLLLPPKSPELNPVVENIISEIRYKNIIS
jgi:hypothetical protein